MKNRFGCFALLVVLGFGTFGAYRVFFPPHVGGVAFNELPPATQKERRVEAQKLVEQVEKVAKTAQKGEKKPFALVASEEQLNTLLQDRLKTEKFPIHDLRAGLSPDQLTLQGTVNYKGFDVPATLTGKLSAHDGTLDFQIDSLQLSGVPAPGAFKDKAEKSISEGLQRALSSDKKARVESVAIESGKLTIRGETG